MVDINVNYVNYHLYNLKNYPSIIFYFRMIKDEIIDDIEYESKHLLVQTLFHKDHTISQQNENNNHTSIRLSE